VVPGHATITNFTYQSGSKMAGEQLEFLVLRPVGPSYTVIGKTALETLAGTLVETFSPPAPIAVQGGDILGLWHPSVLLHCTTPVPRIGGLLQQEGGGPDPSVGDTLSLFGPDTNFDLTESATFVPTQNGNSQGQNNNRQGGGG
jgi:hypothetical protein